MDAEAPFAPEDLRLFERIAARIAELRLETPALLALESARPVSLLASQAMTFLEPVALALFRMADYRRFASLLQRREAVEALMAAIERHAEARTASNARGGRP